MFQNIYCAHNIIKVVFKGQMIVFDFTKARPSRTARSETREGVPSISPDVFMRMRAAITEKKEIALIR